MSGSSKTNLSIALRNGIDQSWRCIATGICFALFALYALAVGLGIAPLVRLASKDRAMAQQRVRRLVRRACRWFVTALRWLGLIDYRLVHSQRLSQPGRLILANHPSLIDALFLLAHTPNASCVVKESLAEHPVTGSVIRAAGFIVNRDPRAVIAAACEALENGQPLILFPEGTRSLPGQPVRLRRGGAIIAALSGAAITPVRIHCEPRTLIKGSPWYRVPPRRPRFTLEIGEVMSAVDTTMPTVRAISALNHRLETYFNDAIWKRAHDESSGT